MKRISNWLLALWMAICSILQFIPDAVLYVWGMMPDDLKGALPPLAVKAISYSVLVLSILMKMHGMKKENKALKDDAGNPD